MFSNGAFWTSRILVACACALLVYSFVALDASGGGGGGGSEAKLIKETDGNNKILNDEAKDSSPRLVFMVIDAFRLSFLTSSDSPMHFTKSSISTGSAHLFDAYARMPTVTLPRITAYITGTLPSFGTILTNFATDEIKIDNWIDRLEKIGKKIHFFGDDTWIRLLPGKFEKFDGVTSFFVNDYTEVDRNVTRHLDFELATSSDSFNVMILHYLGLDHIGHSLGGNSEKISEKLKEMDAVVKRIFEALQEKDGENYLIVCGDHGMTPAGSHGGASPEETRVPVVIWRTGKFSESSKKSKNSETPPPKIEQIDVSSTIFDLFGLEIPSESYGISLAAYFRDETQIIKKQHDHFKRIVKEKNLPISDICEVEDQCDYSDEFIRKSLKKWFRKVQEELIGTASELPNGAIWICVLMLVTATVISIRVWIFQSSPLTLSIFLINIISFASSLIEEEHEIWYYLGSTVVVIRVIQLIRKRRKEGLKSIIFLGIFHRLAYGYMQSTRRRWSMDQNLLPEALFSEVLDGKVQDLNTILGNHPIYNVILMGLTTGWLLISQRKNPTFLLVILPLISQYLRFFEFHESNFHLVNLIRISIIPIAYSTGSAPYGLCLLILTICPISQLILLFLIFQIGKISAKLNLGMAENVIFCMSSFFYTGNSNSLSAVSLPPAYVGLFDYYPIIVGFQLFFYTFAGPIVFMCGRITSSSNNSWLHLHFSYRISALATSLICLFIFQNHLFVWSVYSPKVVYDMTHVIFFGLFLL